MVKDEEMKDTDSSKVLEAEEKKETSPPPPLQAAGQRLERLLGGANASMLHNNPVKVVRRWLSTASGAAAQATADDIQQAAAVLLDPSTPGRALLLFSEPGNINPNYLKVASVPVQAWLVSLAVRILYKDGKHREAYDLAQQGIQILTLVPLQDAALFPLAARLYRWRSLAAESLDDPQLAASLRVEMAQVHNLATLRRDVDTQATLLNCMLRDLMRNHQIEAAQKLLANSTFPETASNNQYCRYLYASGRIQALRLEYTASFSSINQCLRKAPTNTGLGFRIAAQRLLVVVQLLMGEIPERRVFFTPGMQAELKPYLHMTQAVRQGDLGHFHTVLQEHKARFQSDGTYTLATRLQHQVVKAGLRKLHISYSRLSLQDVADRLGLPGPKAAEFVVAKAVRDGVLDATLHHEEGYVQSHDLVNVYATKEPTEAFHRRIAYCLTMHNDAVRGMRYPPDEYKKQLEASRGNRKKRGGDDKTDEEKAKEIEDELDEEF